MGVVYVATNDESPAVEHEVEGSDGQGTSAVLVFFGTMGTHGVVEGVAVVAAKTQT